MCFAFLRFVGMCLCLEWVGAWVLAAGVDLGGGCIGGWLLAWTWAGGCIGGWLLAWTWAGGCLGVGCWRGPGQVGAWALAAGVDLGRWVHWGVSGRWRALSALISLVLLLAVAVTLRSQYGGGLRGLMALGASRERKALHGWGALPAGQAPRTLDLNPSPAPCTLELNPSPAPCTLELNPSQAPQPRP